MNMKIIIFNVFDFLPQSIERKIGEYTILGKSESSIITIEISHPSQSGKKKWVCSYYELIQHLKKRTIPVEYDPFFTSK